MIERRTESQWERVLTYALLLGTSVVFVSQLRSLALFPQPNSLRWFGDETWLLSEAREQIANGIVRYPLAIGSTLEHGKGLVLSLTWLSSLLYGVPVSLAGHDIVFVGRIVTAVLAGGLLVALYTISRRLGASSLAAATCTLLLASTRSFFFSSHSARPDVLAGLIVLLFVGFCTQEVWRKREHGVLWWLTYGLIVALLGLTSSIHLLTLLAPIALFFFIRLGGFKRANSFFGALCGALVAVVALVGIYYASTRSLVLFTHATGHVQFNDVLTSIPVLRPLSRSVQVANGLIRLKELWQEAPIIFLLPFAAAAAWNRRSSTHTLAISSTIVFLSWLLLQGAEINYLIHLLPLLFVCLGVALTQAINRVRTLQWALVAISIVLFVAAMRDSSLAYDNALAIDRSNAEGVSTIEASIARDRHSVKQRVVTEPVTLARLSDDTDIQILTDHFISFPLREEPLDSLFVREHVGYIVLYNSPTYPKNRPKDDPFYQNVERSAQRIATYVGTSGDLGRNYFDRSDWKDTLLLFKFPGSE